MSDDALIIGGLAGLGLVAWVVRAVWRSQEARTPPPSGGTGEGYGAGIPSDGWIDAGDSGGCAEGTDGGGCDGGGGD